MLASRQNIQFEYEGIHFQVMVRSWEVEERVKQAAIRRYNYRVKNLLIRSNGEITIDWENFVNMIRNNSADLSDLLICLKQIGILTEMDDCWIVLSNGIQVVCPADGKYPLLVAKKVEADQFMEAFKHLVSGKLEVFHLLKT